MVFSFAMPIILILLGILVTFCAVGHADTGTLVSGVGHATSTFATQDATIRIGRHAIRLVKGRNIEKRIIKCI